MDWGRAALGRGFGPEEQKFHGIFAFAFSPLFFFPPFFFTSLLLFLMSEFDGFMWEVDIIHSRFFEVDLKRAPSFVLFSSFLAF